MIDNRVHKVRSDFGVSDYYKSFRRKNKDSSIKTSDVYSSILKEFYSHIRESIATKGAVVILPSRIGQIALKKNKPEVFIEEDGTVKNNLPTNWKDTRKLWSDNPSAKEKGIKIKFTNEHTDGWTFKVCFIKSKATFKNKSVYKLRFNRNLKRTLSRSIFEGKIDAFIKQY